MAVVFTLTQSSITLEPMRVTIGGVAMGGTKGGVKITVKHEEQEVTVDQYGRTPVKSFNAGDRIEIKFTLAESSYANLAKVLRTSTLRSTGGTAVGVGGLYAGSKDSTSDAVALLFHPINTDDGTLTRDINVWKATCDDVGELMYGPDGATMFETTWHAYLDTSKTAGKMLIDFGLTAAT